MDESRNRDGNCFTISPKAAGSTLGLPSPPILQQPGCLGLSVDSNRYYDPKTGLVAQEDPIGLAGGLNLYGFANGDPVTFSDPFGLCHRGLDPDCGRPDDPPSMWQNVKKHLGHSP
jgi:hypothetical protein